MLNGDNRRGILNTQVVSRETVKSRLFRVLRMLNASKSTLPPR
jgi:hypothetical protein